MVRWWDCMTARYSPPMLRHWLSVMVGVPYALVVPLVTPGVAVEGVVGVAAVLLDFELILRLTR